MIPGEQFEFDFQAVTGGGDGLRAWRQQRQAARDQLARRLGLPLGRRVEVRLADGVILRGVLGLAEETLFPDRADLARLELVVDGVGFRQSELEACVCLE
jgi:hypothetical protein